MKRNKKDPGLQVGDKIRFVFQWEDEDGKIKTGDPSKVLTVIEVTWRIVGNALIVGDTEDGDFADTKLSADEIMEQIRFFVEDEPLPPPEFRVISL